MSILALLVRFVWVIIVAQVMNKDNKIDGFNPSKRQNSTGILGGKKTRAMHNNHKVSSGFTRNNPQTKAHDAKNTTTNRVKEKVDKLDRAQIDASLNSIDDEKTHKRTGYEKQKRLKGKKKLTGRKKIALWVGVVLLAIILAVSGYLAYKFIMNAGNVFNGNVLGLIQKEPLKMDTNGRSNILVFGTSEDNYEGGKQHDAPYLTDSLMVVSVDQNQNNALMFSIPRDLWVEYGEGCEFGYEGKINALYTCYSNSGENEKAGAEALKSKISEVTGMDVQYYAHVNYSVVQDAVDAVGGVEVEIEGSGQFGYLGIMDRNFDWKCNYECYYVKYPNGPSGVMDGEHALALARARGASGDTYGLSRANYDREVNQRKIMVALQQKALSAGTLADFSKVSKLLDAFGSNLRTNFEQKEVRTLVDIGQAMTEDSYTSLDFASEEAPATISQDVAGQSAVTDIVGLYYYTTIQGVIAEAVKKLKPADSEIVSGDQTHEATVEDPAVVAVYNATGTAGLASNKMAELTSNGFVDGGVGNVDNYLTGSVKYVLYVNNSEMPQNQSELESILGVSARSEANGINQEADFVIVITSN